MTLTDRKKIRQLAAEISVSRAAANAKIAEVLKVIVGELDDLAEEPSDVKSDPETATGEIENL